MENGQFGDAFRHPKNFKDEAILHCTLKQLFKKNTRIPDEYVGVIESLSDGDADSAFAIMDQLSYVPKIQTSSIRLHELDIPKEDEPLEMKDVHRIQLLIESATKVLSSDINVDMRKFSSLLMKRVNKIVIAGLKEVKPNDRHIDKILKKSKINNWWADEERIKMIEYRDTYISLLEESALFYAKIGDFRKIGTLIKKRKTLHFLSNRGKKTMINISLLQGKIDLVEKIGLSIVGDDNKRKRDFSMDETFNSIAQWYIDNGNQKKGVERLKRIKRRTFSTDELVRILISADQKYQGLTKLFIPKPIDNGYFDRSVVKSPDFGDELQLILSENEG